MTERSNFKHAPNIWNLKSFLDHCRDGAKRSYKLGNDTIWIPARPLGLDTIQQRFKAAWLVFTGHADAVKWPKDQ